MVTPVAARCTPTCCADVSLQHKRLCFLRAREHRWLEEARSSYSGSHSSDHHGVKETACLVWQSVVATVCTAVNSAG